MCKHDDCWILKEEIVVSTTWDENFEADFQCNHLGCKEIKRFKFNVSNLEEVKRQ